MKYSIEVWSNMYKIYKDREFIGYALTWTDVELIIEKLKGKL